MLTGKFEIEKDTRNDFENETRFEKRPVRLKVGPDCFETDSKKTRLSKLTRDRSGIANIHLYPVMF